MNAPHDDRRRADDLARRRDELATAIAVVRERIAAACTVVGRQPQEVTLVAITKTRPASDVALLAELGVLDVGENRDQEASAKAAELAGTSGLRWHFVGRLQTNKARHVVKYAHAVHSVDRPEVATALADAAERSARAERLDVFLQVSLDGDPARGGVLSDQLLPLAEVVAARSQLRLRGVMAVAPLGADPDRAFADLAAISGGLRAVHTEATAISAGMSQDYESAVRHGSTYVRVGSALLGDRPSNIG